MTKEAISAAIDRLRTLPHFPVRPGYDKVLAAMLFERCKNGGSRMGKRFNADQMVKEIADYAAQVMAWYSEAELNRVIDGMFSQLPRA